MRIIGSCLQRCWLVTPQECCCSCCPWLTLCALAPPPPSRRWDNKTLITLAIWIGAVPYLIYEVTVGEFNRTDAVAQRPARAMLGSES